MNRRFRLTSSEDYSQVKRDGKSFSNSLFKIIVNPNGMPNSRFGIITGKSVGNAVMRNRCKRLMRASIQTMSNSLQNGWDVVIIVRHTANNVDYQTTLTRMAALFQRAGLLKRSSEDAT